MIEFPVKTGAWTLTAEQIERWARVYRIDVTRECEKALVWIEANPARRKSAKGMTRFLVNWLSKAERSAAVTVRGRDWRPAVQGPSSAILEQAMALAKERHG